MTTDTIDYENNEDLKLLYEIKEKLIEYNDLKDQEYVLKRKEKAYDKQLKEVQNRFDSEKEKTINARRNDIILKYDYQISELQENIKETLEERKEEKKKRKNNSIERETEQYQIKIRSNKDEINRIAEECGITGIYNTRLCYSIFLPYSFWDFILFLVRLSLLILLNLFIIYPLLTPALVRFINYSFVICITIISILLILDFLDLIAPKKGRLFTKKKYKINDLLIMLFETIFIVGLWAYHSTSETIKSGFISVFIFIFEIIILSKIHVSIRNNIYYKMDYDKLTTLKSLIKENRTNTRRIKIETKRIKNDTDEKRYNLDSFDQNIIEIQKKIENVNEEKIKSLNVFENITKEKIKMEIERKYAVEIKNKEELVDDIYDNQLSLASEITKFENAYIIRYRTLLGGIEVSLDNVNSLIDIIEHGRAGNISEAVNQYNEEKRKNRIIQINL